MKILGIETSCDETTAAVVELLPDGNCCSLLSNVIASSIDLHIKYGGVVPEIAARSHIESIIPVIDKALDQAKCKWENVDGISVTCGAGLGGSLLVGVMTARTLAIIKKKPLYAINHVEAHLYANFITSIGSLSPASGQSPKHRESLLLDTVLQAPLLSRSSISTSSSAARPRLVSHQNPTDVKEWKLNGQVYILPRSAPSFPMLGLIVSGGHTQLVLFKDHFKYKLLGQTHDDAIGEAFDKVAKILGLPYPGGPSIAKAAKNGDPLAYNFPKSKLSSKYDFSFSGIKTAVLRTAQAEIGEDYAFASHKLPERLSEAQKANIAASFQRIAIETIVDKTVMAYEEFKPKSVVIGGGVAANRELREQLAKRLPIAIEFQDIKLMGDNGAMVAALGCYRSSLKQKPSDPYKLDISPNLSM